MKIKFTIGIPCYNQASYLLEAIESALDQTYSCEIIIVNDGSTDDSLEYAKSYGSKGVRIINQVNKGLPSSRNTIIMNSMSDYILFLDADDVLLPNCVEEMVKVAGKTNADVIAPSFKTFGLSSQEVILQPNIIIQDFIGGNRLGYFSAIKRSVLLEVGGYSPRMVEGWEDYHLWFDIFSRGKTLITLPDMLVLYRTKENSMYTESIKHSDKLWKQIKKDFPKLWQS